MKKLLMFFLSLTILLVMISGCAGIDKKIACESNPARIKEYPLLQNTLYLSLIPTEPVVGVVSLITHKPLLYLNIINDSITRGNGELVVVIPGLWTNDISVLPMVSSLNRLGFKAYTWQQGMSYADFEEKETLFSEFLYKLLLEHDQKINLIGWSIGGTRAIDFAARHPELIRSVITLGTPYRENPVPIFLQQKLGTYMYHDLRESVNTISSNMPITAIYGRADALVKGQNGAMLDENLVWFFPRENIPVLTSHYGIGFSITTLKIITDRLAQTRNDKWEPYCSSK